MASTRAEYARWSRNRARRFVAARKASLAKGRKVEDDRPLPARERETVTVGLTSPSEEKETVSVGSPCTGGQSAARVPQSCGLPAWEGGKEIVTVGL